ncbi:hypothetical protein [Microbispora sp. NPDC049633]|uniref:hypothetical protein n=1 Tax=Microbispora sp. NPDC049633 TaxID=3154355 RepID=UPI00342BA1BA
MGVVIAVSAAIAKIIVMISGRGCSGGYGVHRPAEPSGLGQPGWREAETWSGPTRMALVEIGRNRPHDCL